MEDSWQIYVIWVLASRLSDSVLELARLAHLRILADIHHTDTNILASFRADYVNKLARLEAITRKNPNRCTPDSGLDIAKTLKRNIARSYQ